MAITINGSTGITYPDASEQVTGNGLAKAWVNFNGTGTVAIRRAFNCSSITDNGVGDYTVNFTNAMVDANYSIAGTCSRGAANTRGSLLDQNPVTPATASSVRVRGITVDTSPGLLDCAAMTIAIFS